VSFFTNKLTSTIKLGFTLMLARTFGYYLYSTWNGGFEYAIYKYRGKTWAFPTTPIDNKDGERG
jgi:hypothetical protein